MIPYGRQEITEADINAVVEVLRSDFLTQGPAVPAFEKKLCNYTGVKHAIAVNSCTSALHNACLALALGPGEILWTSPITFVASANCALYCGATVDFVDVEVDTALMSVEKLEEKLQWAEQAGKLPKIVVPVHFSGQSCDMQQIHTLGQKYGFSIIEDAAHAIGGSYQGEPVGSCRYSDIAVFSFHPVKIITTGEGGAALTSNPRLAEKMYLLRSHGITREPSQMINESHGSWYYEQTTLGFNYRMTDLQAALGCSQLVRLDEYIEKRKEVTEWYDEKLSSMAVEPIKLKKGRRSAHHLYVIRINGDRNKRDLVFDRMVRHGVGVNIHYIPVFDQPYHSRERLAGAAFHYNHSLSIPMSTVLSQDQLDYIVMSLSKSIECEGS